MASVASSSLLFLPVQKAQAVPSLTSLQDTEPKSLERTPRKSANPQHTPVRGEKDESALLTFKFVNSEETPNLELNITATPPTLQRIRKSKAKRRLWEGSSEPMEYINLDIGQNKIQGTADETRISNSPPSPTDQEDKTFANELSFSPMQFESESKQHTLKCSRPTAKSKTCASCSTKKTPLWRDSDDGTPYCNACGIRFKKYRIRCPVCLYVPRKDEKTMNNSCFLCNSQLVRCRFSKH